MNKFNPEAIVCTDFSIDVILFNGDLTPEECSKVFGKAVHEDYPITMLHDVIILGTEEYMKGVKYAPSIIGEDGLALPPLPIHDDIEDIPF